jgi:UDP-N-acetylmuramate: L-alanyl-gamma-D-glutamyl-meso-diaminopimelate ligase
MINYTEQIKDKQRLVFAGSDGCEFLASLCAHVLKDSNRPFDYFSHGNVIIHHPKAPLVLLVPGDTPDQHGKSAFRNYEHHFAVICGINFRPTLGFSTEETYIRQYDLLADATPKGGLIAYCEQDSVASVICNKERTDVGYVPYKTPEFKEDRGKFFLMDHNNELVEIYPGEKSNLIYFSAAREILKKIGVTTDQFFQAIKKYRPS